MFMTGEVELPFELIQAHIRGQLVLFVGAGVSLNAPSNLPLFDALAKEIGDLAVITRRDGETVDHFLGRLTKKIDVHEQAKRFIGRAGSFPNRTHEAVVELARASGHSRIITTNFDEHLIRAADSAGIDLGTKYIATALPVGRDFKGLAHLHGVVSGPAQDLILTDRDFGHAYLTDAWATRFLQQVFDNFTVLFIGYSHTDPIISYLGLGLPSNTRRYVLTDEPGNERWEYLDIKPIGYPPDNNHAALADVLSAWARRAAMGQLDHRAQVTRIAQGSPPATPVDRDYLIDALESNADAAAIFAKTATGAEWLEWAEEQPAFKANFESTAKLYPGSRELAHWYADTYVAEPGNQGEALRTVTRLGLSMNVELIAAVSRAIHKLAATDLDAARRWLVLMATSIPGYTAPQSFFLFMHDPSMLAEHVVLAQAVQPHLSVQRNLVLEALGKTSPTVRADLAWNNQYTAVLGYWKAIGARPDFDFAQYLPTFERALAACYELLSAFNGVGFDSLSYGRSAIESHPQDQFPEIQDILIDALRDGGESLHATQPDLSERWWGLSYALFRRLAIHLIDVGVMSESDKITWILDNKLLWEFDTKHERFILLKNAVGGASPEVRARLFAEIITGPDDDGGGIQPPGDEPDTPNGPGADDERAYETSYEVFNLLAWLGRADPDWTEVANARDGFVAERKWGIREYPDLHSWTSSGTWQSQPPFSQEQFDGYIVTEGINGALHRLLSVEYTHHMDGPEWSDALNLIRTSVTVSPDIGIEIWDSEELTNASDENRNSITDAIVQAWSGLTLNAESAAAVLTRLLVRTAVVESAWSIARFISEQVRLQAEHLTSGQLASMGAIARKLWDLHAESLVEREDAEAASLSLNSWPGLVSHFWILEISARWRADREGWNGLDDEERLALEHIVAGSPRGAAQSAIPALTRELAFLFNADPQFTVAAIVPLFGRNTPLDWSWGSYLYNPSWNDGLLEQGFYEHVLNTISRLEELDSKRGLDRQFLNLVLNIVSFSASPLDRRLELMNAIVIKDDGDWASRLVRDLIGFYIFGTLENNEPLWEDWLRTWMTQRLIGIPRTPSTEELAAWADLIPYLGGNAAAALALFGDRAVPMTSQYVHPKLDAIDLRPIVDDYIRHLSLRVTATTIADFDYFGLTYQVRDLIEVLTGTFDSATVAPLLAAAAEKGISL